MFELTDTKSLDLYQTDLVKRHLAMVFKHDIDPKYPAQAELNAIHAGGVDPLAGVISIHQSRFGVMLQEVEIIYDL
jgi:hypothetical protein